MKNKMTVEEAVKRIEYLARSHCEEFATDVEDLSKGMFDKDKEAVDVIKEVVATCDAQTQLIDALKNGIYVYWTVYRSPEDTAEESIHNPENYPVVLLKSNNREKVFGLVYRQKVFVDFENECFYYNTSGIEDYDIPSTTVRYYFKNRGKHLEYGWGLSEEELL